MKNNLNKLESSNILNTIFIPNEIKKLLSKFNYELNSYLKNKLNQIKNLEEKDDEISESLENSSEESEIEENEDEI